MGPLNEWRAMSEFADSRKNISVIAFSWHRVDGVVTFGGTYPAASDLREGGGRLRSGHSISGSSVPVLSVCRVP